MRGRRLRAVGSVVLEGRPEWDGVLVRYAWEMREGEDGRGGKERGMRFMKGAFSLSWWLSSALDANGNIEPRPTHARNREADGVFPPNLHLYSGFRPCLLSQCPSPAGRFRIPEPRKMCPPVPIALQRHSGTQQNVGCVPAGEG